MVKSYKIKHLGIIAALLLIFASCSEWDFIGSGDTTKAYENLGHYQNIEIRGIYTVKLKQSKQNKVIVSGTRNQLENINIISDENQLKIETEGNELWQSDYKRPELTIFIDSLREIWSYQPINLISKDTIRSNKLKIYLIL